MEAVSRAEVLVVTHGESTGGERGAVEVSMASAVLEREAAQDVLNISSGARCRALRLLLEAVIRCDADPEDMVSLYHTFYFV